MPAPHHLKLDRVSFSYPGKRVLTDVSLTVPAGAVVGLIGENGSGKSTLLGLIAREHRPDAGTITRPPVTGFIAQETALPHSAPARELIDAAVAELRAVESRISELSALMAAGQDVTAEFDAALSFATEAGVWELDARIAEVLAGLSLAHVPLSTPLGRMSGGQRRRFALATALLRPADALVLDEPTNHLDDAAVDFLCEQLRDFSGPVLVASHDRYFLDTVADSVVDLDPALTAEGTATAEGTPRQGAAFGGGFSDYLKQRARARQLWKERFNAQAQLRERLESRASQSNADVFHHDTSKSESKISTKFYADRAAKTVGNRVRSARARLEELERAALPAPPEPLRFAGITPQSALAALGEPAVHLRGVGVRGRLAPVHLKVQPGEHVLIVGPNGAGKSTLLDVIEGRLAPDQGQVRVAEDVRVGRLSQDTVWPDLSLSARQVAGKADLVALGLLTPAQADMPLRELSLGQRQRVALGALVAAPPDVLILDEPTNHLSLALAGELEDALEDFPGTVIMATHDRWIRRRWPRRRNSRVVRLEPLSPEGR